MKRCPHCAQPMPEPGKLVRVCYDCKNPIRRHDKWMWAERANVSTATCTAHCENPESLQSGREQPSAAAPLFDGEIGMIFGSVCTGIGAPELAWQRRGWRCAFVSEIETFPRAVLRFHHPKVPLHGDFTTIQADEYEPIQLLVGGTPCQSFSIAGLRGGLADQRGNLALEYLRLADRLRPKWVVWENVPGVFSSLSHDAPDPRPPDIDLDAGNGPADGEEIVVEDSYDADESHAFSCFLAALSELGYGFAYRVLDAQHVEHASSLGPSLSGGGVSSLSDILETGDHLRPYFLSAKACLGILRRAEKRGKDLPLPHVARALRAVADSGPTST